MAGVQGKEVAGQAKSGGSEGRGSGGALGHLARLTSECRRLVPVAAGGSVGRARALLRVHVPRAGREERRVPHRPHCRDCQDGCDSIGFKTLQRVPSTNMHTHFIPKFGRESNSAMEANHSGLIFLSTV